MTRRSSSATERNPAGDRPRVRGRVAALLACIALATVATYAHAATSADIADLLQRADSVKLRDPGRFDVLMASIGARLHEASESQRQHYLFLQGWKDAFDGKDAAAVSLLSRLATTSPSEVVRFRAYATLSDLFTAQGRYQLAFQNLSEAQNLLPNISDGQAREEGLLDAAELYGEVGQYKLALAAAQAVIDQNWKGEGACMGAQQKLHALFNAGRLAEFDAQVKPAIESCLRVGQPAYANQIRGYLAARDIDAGRLDEARELLTQAYPQIRRTGYGRQIASFDALLALASQKKGDLPAARRFAADAVKLAIPGEFPHSLITAYDVLYRSAKRRGQYAAALAYHEKYADAKIGYLNDVSARQLAYERVKQQSTARELQIETLRRKNSVLELQRQLAAKRVEATRLYGVIITLSLVFIGLWALQTKRSQIHFMNLSQLDGLTGISNRLHFIERAEAALTYARRSGQDISLVLFDLDHFKSINDRFGHGTGDFVLKRTVTACREYLRRSDTFGRFGGEEFSVLLPGCRLEAAREQAEQLRQTINSIETEERGARVTVSASFGIACTSASGYELARLLAHADAALYRAKRAGRNCVMAYDPAESGRQSAITPPLKPDESPS